MKSLVRSPFSLLASLAILAGVLAVPAVAAASTTVTPAGDSFTIGSGSTITFLYFTGTNTTCKVSGGTAAVPASPGNHSSGTVTAKFSKGTLAFSSCTGVPATVSGSLSSITWNGEGSHVYIEGNFSVTASSCQWRGPSEFEGTWTNGTVSPHVDSSASMFGEIGEAASCGGGIPTRLPAEANLKFVDTTNLAQVITLTE